MFFGYIIHILPQYDQEFNASLIDKVNRLESINEPKIVLLGHSNLPFGMNSELLEESMGMPVVNMGLHGALGNAFHEEMAKYNIVPGDVYVLCHSNFNDDDTIKDPVTAWITIENHYKLWDLIRIRDIMDMLRKLPVYIKKSLILYSTQSGNMDPGGVYSRNAFNCYGDVEVLRTGNHYAFKEEVYPPLIGDITVRRINRLNRYITERGAALVVAGYPIGKGPLTVDEKNFEVFQQQLQLKLDCPVISNYVDYMFDYSYFYDTYQHLTSEGADMRTRQLILDLKKWQNEEKL